MQERFKCPNIKGSVAFERCLLFSWEILRSPGRSLPGQDGGCGTMGLDLPLHRSLRISLDPDPDSLAYPSPFLHAFVGRPAGNLSLDTMVCRRSNNHPLHVFVELPGRSLLR
jgi:hypothetical protein